MSNQIMSLSIAPPWLWIGFLVVVVVLLAVDLSIFKHTKNHGTKFSLMESAAWISVALAFNVWLGWYFGREIGLQFLTGYLVEKSLSVDNLFVILLVFASFKIPKDNQHKVLFWGILGAILMRGFFIIVGAQLLHMFHWILYIFGAILLYTGYKFLFESDDAQDVKDNWAIALVKKVLPISNNFNGAHFFISEDNIRKATPLFLALVVIEATDLVFAVDSIPAVFSVTSDAFIAFSSNILALLGLRALYFVLAEGASKLRYLKPGLAAVLGFIGAKMLIVDFVKIPSWVSLLVIAAILTTAGLGSWYAGRKQPTP